MVAHFDEAEKRPETQLKALISEYEGNGDSENVARELKDTEGFDWLESAELGIDKRKFLPSRMYEKQPIPQDQD